MEVLAALEAYLASTRRQNRPKTTSEKRRIIGYFAEFCREKSFQLEQISPRIVDEYLDHLQSTHHSKKGGELSTHTVFLHTNLIKIFLNFCAKSEELEQFVKPTLTQRIHSPKRDTLIKDMFSKEQIHALLAACEMVDVGSEKTNTYLRARDRAIILLLLDTGIRAAELCGLTMQFLFTIESDPHIRVMGKGSKVREVGLGKKCRAELEQFVRNYRAGVSSDAPVFLTRHGQPISETSLFHIIERLGKVAKIEGVRCSPHTFRHTYSCLFMVYSNDVYRLSKLLGHQHIHTTEQYLRSFSAIDARRGAVSPADHLT